MAKILLIEDKNLRQDSIHLTLEQRGYEVTAVHGSETDLFQAQNEAHDLIILNLSVASADVFKICKRLRANEKTSKVPVIIMSASDQLLDKVVGLEAGADDFVVKPCNRDELIARVKARLRKHSRSESNTGSAGRICLGNLEIWPDNYTVTLAGQPVNLTVKEFDLMKMFIFHPNRVFSREYLLEQVWGCDSGEGARKVDVIVSSLRYKLQKIGNGIETVRGMGYRFRPGNHGIN